MSNGLRWSFGFKRLAAILLLAVVVLVVLILSVNGLFVSSANQPTSAATPTRSPPTASPTEAATPTSSPTQIPIPVDFTCRYDGGNETFIVTATVDLNDGMNRDEAVTAATLIINHELTNAKHEVRIAEVSSSGEWHVGFNWEYGMVDANGTIIAPMLGHVFDVTINAQNRTATYTRCM